MPPNPGFELRETTLRRVVFSTAAAAWFAALSVVLIAGVLVFQRPQRQEDPLAVINGYVDATTWAQDYLLLWLGGGPAEAKKLATMTALPTPVDLNKDPVTVLSIRPEPGILRTPAADGNPEIEWALTLSAVIIAPGSGGASVRTYYRLTFLQAGTVYKALLYPRPTNHTSQPVEIQSHYTVGVPLDGALASTVREFMTAFYITGNDGNLGRYVTTDFTDKPITKSAYTALEISSITAGTDSADAASANPGDTMHLLVTAKASASIDTFHWISAPLRVTLSPNRQWLVEGFDEPVRFGAVNYQ